LIVHSVKESTDEVDFFVGKVWIDRKYGVSEKATDVGIAFIQSVVIRHNFMFKHGQDKC
jgi:hypothetical protein